MKEKYSKEQIKDEITKLVYGKIDNAMIYRINVSFSTKESAIELLDVYDYYCPEDILLNHYYNFPEDFKHFKKKEHV